MQKLVYLNRVADECKWVDLVRLAPQIGGQLLRLRLDDVFVQLHAQEDVSLVDDAVREQLRLWREQQASGATPDEIEYWLLDRENRPTDETGGTPTDARRVKVEDAFFQANRLVVLGEPGAGKTTLLRYVARLAATGSGPLKGCLPVYVNLRDYDDYCQKRGETSFRAYVPAAAENSTLMLTPELLTAEVAAGSCVFLLDGLDEIANVDRRLRVRNQIREFADSHRSCRVVVTSRIVGYRDSQLPSGTDGFRHFTLCPLDDDEIAQFARCWFDAVRLTGTPNAPEPQSSDALIRDLRSNPRARKLAANPLLMTLIVLIYRRGGELRRRRIELYRDATLTLLSTWRHIDFDEQQATMMLMAVAFHMHNTGSSVISRPELEKLLVQRLVDPDWAAFSEMDAQENGRFLARKWASGSTLRSADLTMPMNRSTASYIRRSRSILPAAS